MKKIIQLSIALATTCALAVASIATTAPKGNASRHLIVAGRVLKIDKKMRTLLVSDYSTKKLYLVKVGEYPDLKIRFGTNAKLTYPEFKDVQKNDRVWMKCVRPDQDHLARIDEDRSATVLISANR